MTTENAVSSASTFLSPARSVRGDKFLCKLESQRMEAEGYIGERLDKEASATPLEEYSLPRKSLIRDAGSKVMERGIPVGAMMKFTNNKSENTVCDC